MANPNSTVQVMIVGAGPTGLILAIWLRKRGVSVRIVDKSTRPGTTSRALAVQARTLEFYRQLGLADALIRLGTLAREVRLRRFGRIVARAKFGEIGRGMSHFPYLLFCSQDVHEELLCAELEKLGTRVERSTEVTAIEQASNSVKATLKSANGIEHVEASYLCGCDGAHSTVRHELEIGFPGGTYTQVFYVADVLVPESSIDRSDQGVQISLSAKDFCIVMPIQTKGTIRLTGIVPPESESREVITFADVSESVRRNTGLIVDKVNWFSTYRVHHRVADSFRKGRVFLAGDAGHIHSPAGGQGMNTGIGDAVNLAWKLADVVNGRASERLLESYEPERIAFARTLVETTDTAFKFIATRNYAGSLFRAYVMPGFFATLTRVPAFLRLIFRTVSQIRIKYRKSPLSTCGPMTTGNVRAGDRLPWVKFDGDDNFEPLKSLAWQVHVYGKSAPAFREALEACQLSLHVFDFSQQARERQLLRDHAYLVRPDGHIAAIFERQDPSAISAYLRNL